MFKLGMALSLGVFAVFATAREAPAQGRPAALGQPLPQVPLPAPTLPVPQPAPQQPPTDPTLGLLLQLTPPAPERLFQFKSEEQIRQHIREDFKGIRKVEFPPEAEVPPSPVLPPRTWPFLTETVAPCYVCHKRLWFEQSNSERYGRDFGIMQPVISTGIFYTDLALLPWHWLTDPCRWYDCSAGKCLPGDLVPLYWNPVFSGK